MLNAECQKFKIVLIGKSRKQKPDQSNLMVVSYFISKNRKDSKHQYIVFILNQNQAFG